MSSSPQIISFLVFFEVKKQNDSSFWQKHQLRVRSYYCVADMCSYFWKQLKVCFSFVEYCCSPKEKILHRLSKEEQEIPLSLIFADEIKRRHPIEGYFVFRCCYFTTWDSKVYHIKIFYDLNEVLLLKLYSNAKIWFIVSAFASLTNKKFCGEVFLVVDQTVREIPLSDDTLESFVSQNKLLSPLSEESSISLYFW